MGRSMQDCQRRELLAYLGFLAALFVLGYVLGMVL